MSIKKKIVAITVLTALYFILSSQNTGGTIKKNGQVYNPDGIEMVYVEGSGSGIYGINGFYIGKYPITQKEWKAVMGGANPSKFKDDDNPVENVSWLDVQEFIKRLNRLTGRSYRLPTESEWDYAAKGGSLSRGYIYSGSNNLDEVAWYRDNSYGRTHKVGSKKPNELGIYDMNGNVWEWTENCYDGTYDSRVLCGGSYFWDTSGNSIAFRLKRVNRHGVVSDVGGVVGDYYGFRLVL